MRKGRPGRIEEAAGIDGNQPSRVDYMGPEAAEAALMPAYPDIG